MDENTRQRITVVGSANVDLTFQTARLPCPGETVAGNMFHQGMGGKGANQAVVAARLGADVAFVACVGNDSFGTEAIRKYQADGINTAFVRRSAERPTGTAAILLDANAENCIVVVPGANGDLSREDVQSAASVIEDSAVVICQLETPVEAAIEAFEFARNSNVLTMLTPAPAENVTDELLAVCDLCVPNKTEIAAITGLPVETEADAIRAARCLLHRGVKQVALTMGSDGVLLVDDVDAHLLPAAKVNAVDTTGAGDAFTGAFAVSIANGLNSFEAAQCAIRVAAISVTREGTQTSFPSRHEVDNWNSNEESRSNHR